MENTLVMDKHSSIALDSAKHTGPGLRRRVHRLLGSFQRTEAFYQFLVHEVARHHEFDYVPMPVGAAANYGLLYTIYRIVTSINNPAILELGAGQSTLFIDRLSKHYPMRISTLEHDPDWHQRISAQVQHEVKLAPLRDKTLDGQQCLAYELDQLGQERFDIVIVDGPLGTSRNSRWGAIEVIQNHLNHDFILVFDDVDRIGELDTATHVLRSLNLDGRTMVVRSTIANKTQLILASEKYAHIGQLF